MHARIQRILSFFGFAPAAKSPRNGVKVGCVDLRTSWPVKHSIAIGLCMVSASARADFDDSLGWYLLAILLYPVVFTSSILAAQKGMRLLWCFVALLGYPLSFFSIHTIVDLAHGGNVSQLRSMELTLGFNSALWLCVFGFLLLIRPSRSKTSPDTSDPGFSDTVREQVPSAQEPEPEPGTQTVAQRHRSIALVWAPSVMLVMAVILDLIYMASLFHEWHRDFLAPKPIMFLASWVPLVFFSKSKTVFITRLKMIGFLVFLFNLTPFIQIFNTAYEKAQARLESKKKFDTTMALVSIAGIHEQPMMIDGKVAGLKIGVEVKLAQPIPVDRYGVAVYKMLRYFSVETATSSRSSPFANGPTTTTLDGVAVDTLPGVNGLKKALSDGFDGMKPGYTLPAGRYLLEATYWLPGLSNNETAALPCTVDQPGVHPEESDGKVLEVSVGVGRFDTIPGERPSIAFEVRKPLAFRYDYRQWMADRAALEQVGLPTCALRDKAREKAKFLDAYQNGSTDMIKGLACKDELDTVATLFAAIPQPPAWFQPSAWLLAEVAVECTITTRRPAMFELIVSQMHRTSGKGDHYCKILASLHDAGDLDYLTRLENLGLPIVCEGKHTGS